MRTRIKICGFTDVEMAVKAAHMGVDAIGLVFYPPSPRHVSLATAADIAKAVPAFVTVVALFVDAARETIAEVLQAVQIDCLQFHGDEPAVFCRQFNKPYIKAIRMTADVAWSDIEREYDDAAGILLDAYHPGVAGGSGQVFDWDMIPSNSRLPIILAGGLSPDNAALAIQSVRPYALDVSSGVEREKGIKDADKMAAFITITNQATEDYD